MCSQCDAVLCPECHSEHVCPVDSAQPPAAAGEPQPQPPAPEQRTSAAAAALPSAAMRAGSDRAEQAHAGFAPGHGFQPVAAGGPSPKHAAKRLPSAHRMSAVHSSSHSVEITASGGSGSK